MKLLVFALVILHVVDNAAGQCKTGWTYVAERCMRCSSSLGLSTRGHLAAETACNDITANLATLTTVQQAEFARLCGAGGFSWIGYRTSPRPMFIDGTLSVAIGQNVILNDVPSQCFVVKNNDKLDWDDVATCTNSAPFTCTQDPVSCPNLETRSPLGVGYSNTGDGTPPAGKQWMDTVATYSCSTGYSLSGGTTTRTCQGDATWSGSLPICIGTGSGFCAAIPQPSNGMIHYSSIGTSAGAYVVGTIANQTCDDGYDMASGTSTRTCTAAGTWNGTPISCEKDNDGLVIGLAVGLGLMTLGVIIGVLVYCFCRPETSRPPARRPYPRSRSGYPKARRSYPRRARDRD